MSDTVTCVSCSGSGKKPGTNLSCGVCLGSGQTQKSK